MKLSANHKINVGFGSVLALLLAIAWYIHDTNQRFMQLTELQVQGLEALERLTQFLAHVNDAETSQRAFLLTGKQEYLRPYEAARKDIARELTELDRLAAEQPNLKQALARLRPTVNSMLTVLERAIVLRRGNARAGLEMALQSVLTRQGERDMDAIRTAIDDMRYSEQSSISRWMADADEQGGRTHWLVTLVGPIAFVGIVLGWWLAHRHLTQQRVAIRALHTSEERFQLLVDGIQDYAIVMLDANGNVLDWNAASERILGYLAEEAVGKKFSRFYPLELIEAGVPDRMLEDAALGRCEREVWHVRSDGSRFWANVILTPINDEEGKLQGYSKITRDLTERRAADALIRQLNNDLERRVELRTAELARVNAELAQRNQENELFVFGVSHDLRSPLVNLQGFSEELGLACLELRELLTKTGIPPDLGRQGLTILDDEMLVSARFIQTAVLRLNNVIDALLRLSRAGRVEYQWQEVDLTRIVRDVVDSFGATISQKNAVIEVGRLGTVWGDATALELVFANLIDNALKYLAPDRRGRIEIGLATRAEVHNGKIPKICCQVRDNGLGIALDGQNKLFHVFQRLHPEAAPGEGMGLVLTRRIVERHRGRIWVESQPNGGSTFFVDLPTQPHEAPSAADVSDLEKVSAHG